MPLSPCITSKRSQKRQEGQDTELSRLAYIERILEKAADKDVPLWERWRFFDIVCCQTDEFFEVRMAKLYTRAAKACNQHKGSDISPRIRQELIVRRVRALLIRKKAVYAALCRLFSENGICLFDKPPASLKVPYKDESTFSCLSESGQLAAVVLKKNGSLSVRPLSPALPALTVLSDRPMCAVRTDRMVLQTLQAKIGEAEAVDGCVVRITRSRADLSQGDRFATRLEIDRPISLSLQQVLCGAYGVSPHLVFVDPTPLDRRFFSEAAQGFRAVLSPAAWQSGAYPPHLPQTPAWCAAQSQPIDAILQKDRLLLFPFHAFSPIIRLLQDAAARDDLRSISITLYRVAPHSRLLNALCQAAQNGKTVRVIAETRARGDEAHNRLCAKTLAEAGCRVYCDTGEQKCHAKICLLTFSQNGKERYITQIGTGNYNEVTAAQYTDAAYFTADARIGKEATRFFEEMCCKTAPAPYQLLSPAPFSLRQTLYTLIERERQKGENGKIQIKANALTDREIVERLQAAADAGVHIHLLIRGSCALLPFSHLRIRAIVGRFLEHTRLFCFGSGTSAQVLLSSADLMKRNLNRRYELACPICDPAARQTLLSFFEAQWNDTENTWELQQSGKYCRRKVPGQPTFDSHALLLQNPP